MGGVNNSDDFFPLEAPAPHKKEKLVPIIPGNGRKRTPSSNQLPYYDLLIDPKDFPPTERLLIEHLPDKLNSEQRNHVASLRKGYESSHTESDGTRKPSGKINPGLFVRVLRLVYEIQHLSEYPEIQSFVYRLMGISDNPSPTHEDKHSFSEEELIFLQAITKQRIIGRLDDAVFQGAKQDLEFTPKEYSGEENIKNICKTWGLYPNGTPIHPLQSIRDILPAHLLPLLGEEEVMEIYTKTRKKVKKLFSRKWVEAPDFDKITKDQNRVITEFLKGRESLRLAFTVALLNIWHKNASKTPPDDL